MQHAVIEARKTIGKFIAALKHPAQGEEDFEIKEKEEFDHAADLKIGK